VLSETYALAVRDLRRWWRHPMEIVLVFTTPLMWLLLFGQAFNIGNLVPSGPVTPGAPSVTSTFGGAADYFSFMALGQIALIVMFSTFFSGVSILYDRKSGFLYKLQVAPIPRSAIPLSRISASIFKSMLQAAVVLLLAVAFTAIPGLNGLHFATGFGVADLLLLLLFIVLIAMGFSALFTALGLAVKNEETLWGLINILNFPLMFTSSALVPISLMPDWLATIARYNPVTFAVDGMRQLVFQTDLGAVHSLGADLLGIAVFCAVMIGLGAFLSRRALMRA